MLIDPATAPIPELYAHLTNLVTPRPIAWVTTLSPAGVVNLAPFSFFNLFGANPPIVVFSPTLTRSGTKKDTLRNVEATGEFVIHTSTAAFAEKINASSKELKPDESEVELVGLATAPSTKVQVPRLVGPPVAFECKLRQILDFGTGPIAPNLIVGEIVLIHIDEAVLGDSGRADPRKLQTIARLGDSFWCHTTDLFEQTRP